jgi:hypothetical protein
VPLNINIIIHLWFRIGIVCYGDHGFSCSWLLGDVDVAGWGWRSTTLSRSGAGRAELEHARALEQILLIDLGQSKQIVVLLFLNLVAIY